MKIKDIATYQDFLENLNVVGFTLITDNDEGIFSLSHYFADTIKWHTGNEETDPWAYRTRLISENDHISYGKVFFKKSGYITKEWLPYFIKLRRKALNTLELYEGGYISKLDKDIYDYLQEHKTATPLQLQQKFGKEQKKAISKSLVELQMLLLVTTFGETYKISQKGEPYGWPIAVFTTIEHKFGQDVEEEATYLVKEDAYDELVKHIKALNPSASDKRIKAFLKVMT